MSDNNQTHELEETELSTRDIMTERLTAPMPEPAPDERGDLFKAMAFEADRQVKVLHARLDEIRHLVQAADNELAHYERQAAPGRYDRCISNARAALTKAKEVA